MRQLILDLPLPQRLAGEDFLVSPANARAHGLAMAWPDWPAPAVLICGPAGSGKTHLTEIWRERAGAVRLAPGFEIADLPFGFAAVLDDLPGALGERELFHILNLAREQRGHLLLASRQSAAAWPVALPDLASRLKALPSAEIEPPDDALLRAVLAKHFHDRQIRVGDAVLSYLVLRMPRSLGAARALAQAIDRRALEEKAEVTRAFAAAVLAEAMEPGLFEPD